jgi:hypothetical protein
VAGFTEPGYNISRRGAAARVSPLTNHQHKHP